MAPQLGGAAQSNSPITPLAICEVQVDKAALDAQVRERREREAAEAEADRAAALAAAEYERTVQQRAAAATEERRAQHQGSDAFRRQQEVRLLAGGREGGSGACCGWCTSLLQMSSSFKGNFCFLLQETRRRVEAEARACDAAASAAEQATALASPWLNEAPQTTVSALAPHRWRPDHFKGLAPEQRAAILATQAEQVQAKRAAQAASAA